MDDIEQGRRRRDRPAAALARVPTGIKLLLILSGALLPLALIAVFATLQTTRSADVEARARLGVAIGESSGTLGSELRGDIGALREALRVFADDPDNAPSCARVSGVFASQIAGGARFAVQNRGGELVCGTEAGTGSITPANQGQVAARIRAGQGLELAVLGQDGAVARAFFPVAFLAEIAEPSGFMPDYGSWLILGDDVLELNGLEAGGALDRTESADAEIGVGELAVRMKVRSAPITSPVLVAMLLPLLMWAAAAGIGWFVVDRLLIRPLRRLRTSVGAYQPGEVIDPVKYGAIPAMEIRELGDTFRDISRTVQAHEAELAEGLDRQTRLTREVHHRVKNNLQVIASLINFHARGAPTREATDAYSSIQRRVDALAVVHRYHYAGFEDNRGLEIRSVIGELASNIRATAPEESHGLGITLDIESYMVSQDVAVAVAFLITEILELAMNCNHGAQISISVKPDTVDDRAMLRVSSPALVDSPELVHLLESRYGRVLGGLVRQLRSKLHHDPLVGAYETSIAVLGKA
jgi:two-component sensor histidine kinase